ncbi:MAG: GAF domain-containing protein [Burkholderiales bacterium]|nr:GAF domain-containing protein [Burkholderiales bacterium]
MRVRFWGTRGSIAVPGPATVRYGGNTSCVELRSASGTLVVIDCGTGARALAQALMKEATPPATGHVLISHTHWDHIQGLPFFQPLFVPGNEWHIYAPHGFEKSLKETLAGQMQYAYFPVALRDLGANIHYHEMIEGTFSIGDIRVATQFLNHPALTLGFRFESGGVCVVYCCDHEPHSHEHADDRRALEGADRDHADFAREADLLIHDAQYVADEYADKRGWGHSTAEYAVQVAREARVRRLALTHHDPSRTDDEIDGVIAGLRASDAAAGSPMQIFAAAEGQTLALEADESRLATPLVGTLTSATAPVATSSLVERTVLLGIADAATAAVLLDAVRADGLRVIVESEGVRTCERAREALPALVIVEDTLPGMSGPEVARAIRQSGAAGELPSIIAVTGRAPDAARARGGDITEWLVKPFSQPYAQARIRACLLRSACQWVNAPVPPDEESRLAALHGLGVLDTAPEERFDRLARLAAAIFEVPTAMVSLVDRDRQWFKSAIGTRGARETPREVSFCAHAVASRMTLVVPDTLYDERFADNPMVTGGPRVRFYAGEPLILPDGNCVGTVCLIDTRPREVDAPKLALLRDIGALVQRELLLGNAPAVAS